MLPPLALIAMAPFLLLGTPLRWVFRDPSQPVTHAALGANVVWNLATNALMAVALVVS